MSFVSTQHPVKREIKRFKNIEDYNPYQAQKDYKQKHKKCIKKLPKFTKEQLDFIKIIFNKYHDTPEQLIYRYFLEFSVKFPACVKTLYEWIRLGEFGLKKKICPIVVKNIKQKENLIIVVK